MASDVSQGVSLSSSRIFAGRSVLSKNQPDAIYGRFVANGLREAAIRNEPMLNDIDALVRSPGRKEQRIRYTRLTLPVLGPENDRQLLSATLLDRGIDLRIDLLDQESENIVD